MEGQTVSQAPHLCLSEPGLQGITRPLCVVIGLQPLLDSTHPGEGHLQALSELLLRHDRFWVGKGMFSPNGVGTVTTRRHSSHDLSCSYWRAIDTTIHNSTAFSRSQTLSKDPELHLMIYLRITGHRIKNKY